MAVKKSERRIELLELEPTRRISFDEKKHGIHKQGEDNSYPTRAEILIQNSVTARSASRMLAKYIQGRGWVDNGKTKVNKNGLTANKFLSKLARSLSKHRGAFIHVNYNGLHEINGLDVIPYRFCRLGMADSNEYIGKVIVYDNWDLTKHKKIISKNFDVIDVYNPDFVADQIALVGDIRKYKGQVLYMNLDDNELYSFSQIDPVQEDCDTEAQISIFKNKTVRKGFFGKTIIRHEPFEDDPDAFAFKKKFKEFLGAKNAESVLLVEDDLQSDDKSGQFRIEKLKYEIDDKIFVNWEKSISNNIRKCFNNIPPPLIDWIEGKLGNASGKAYQEAKVFFNEQTEEERLAVENIVSEIMGRSVWSSLNWQIKEITQQ